MYNAVLDAHNAVIFYNETWSKLGGYALLRLDIERSIKKTAICMSVCILWSKENMGGGMGCPLQESTRRKDASSFLSDTSFCHGPGLLVGK
ncbi:hypothetical protein CMV_002661 [Castanea mollissima]|uniref:Uncharacterized protein n=1 Tax=Castanea mollissima TaxID=60419 RepID=A0A8J4S1E0_9ROSI|nr:hypothetical protein CMV_002661 [Castanea mollissima]